MFVRVGLLVIELLLLVLLNLILEIDLVCRLIVVVVMLLSAFSWLVICIVIFWFIRLGVVRVLLKVIWVIVVW